MKTKLFILSLICLVSISIIHAQGIRAFSMAGITIPLKDDDNSCDPYDFGGNISFLYLDETSSWLKINPSFNSNWGDYKRPLDAGKNNLYGLSFSGLKTLGTDGTFLGTVTYLYDSRINVNRSIKYNTYKGEAFFINDSTTGDTRFTGPAVNFGYSLELIPDLYFGASAGYKIFNGLKAIYSQTSTVLRNVDGTVGLTYRLFNGAFLSVGLSAYNSQESMTAQLVNPVDVEIYNYHGNTYKLYDRGSSIPEKIKELGYSWNSQLYYNPDEHSELGVNFVYSNSDQKILFPNTVNGNSVLEYEDGYSYFNDFLFEIKGRYDLIKDLTVGIKGSYLYNRCWSKLPTPNLLIWDWNTKTAGVGIGAAYNVTQLFLVTFEYNYSRVSADSSKYIDNRFVSVRSNDHIIKIGGEYEIEKGIFVRAGGGYGSIGTDIVFGGSDIKYGLVTFGVGLNIFSSFRVDILLDYNNYKPKQLDFSRSYFDGLVSFRLFNI